MYYCDKFFQAVCNFLWQVVFYGGNKMSEKVKLFISEDDLSHFHKLKEIIALHPEFELCNQPITRAGRMLDSSMSRLRATDDDTASTKTLSGDQDFVLLRRISDIFITVGIPAHIQGYKYLREAIKLTVGEPSIINCITKQLYPTIAKQFATTPSKVERAIRHAIEVGWSRGKIENINNIFGVKVYGHNDRPTNGEFIALVADKMMVDGIQ